jgi:hypothetical protein
MKQSNLRRLTLIAAGLLLAGGCYTERRPPPPPPPPEAAVAPEAPVPPPPQSEAGCGRACARLRLDQRLLGMARTVGLDRWPMDMAAVPRRCVGAGPLGPSSRQMGLETRSLAINAAAGA